MVSMGEQELKMPLLRAVEQVNEEQKRVLADKVRKHFGSDLSGLTFALWGLSFKPRTDDMREAPSIIVIESLLKDGAQIQAYDPEASAEAKKVFGERIHYAKRNYDALRGADALIVVTEWNEFRRPNFQRIKELLKHPVIFDGRNIYDPAEMRKVGITYYSIGGRDG